VFLIVILFIFTDENNYANDIYYHAKLKEILRLKYGCKLSHRQIAKSLSVSPSVVSRYSSKAAELGIACWPLDDKWNDQTLQQSFFKTKPRLKGFAIPDWSLVQQELRPKTQNPKP
jgi:hypothetical protein